MARESGLAAQVVGKVVVLTGALMMARKEATAKYVSLSPARAVQQVLTFLSTTFQAQGDGRLGGQRRHP